MQPTNTEALQAEHIRTISNELQDAEKIVNTLIIVCGLLVFAVCSLTLLLIFK